MVSSYPDVTSRLETKPALRQYDITGLYGLALISFDTQRLRLAVSSIDHVCHIFTFRFLNINAKVKIQNSKLKVKT
jgi:hypothetical protein